MRGKVAKALRKIVRAKYPQLDEADKAQFKNYFRKVKKVYKSLPRTERNKMTSVKVQAGVTGAKVLTASK